jgi:DUF3040 family protein
VSLSAYELRVLNEIEQALAREDPRFASSLGSGSIGSPGAGVRSRLRVAVLMFAAAVGIGCIIFGLIAANGVGAVVATTGFVLIVASCCGAIRLWRRRLATEGRLRRKEGDTPW